MPGLTSRFRAPKSISYIDQIFHQNGTLAQQAIVSGDRSAFRLLVDEFGADLTLPYSYPVKWDDRHQINVFALLVYTDHFDPWFA
jgi:hypothetical protein